MAKKQKQQKRNPITPEVVARTLEQWAGGDESVWFTRREIAAMLGRKKTSHVIRTIEAAVAANLVRSAWGTDEMGRNTVMYQFFYLPF